MSSSDDSVDSEDESGEPSVKRRRTLNPLNADAALALVKNACDNIKLGSRLEFFGPALVMLADALHESSQRNAGSARFQRAASNPTWVCTSRDGTMIYSISEDDKLNAGQRSGSVRAWDIYGKYYGGSSSGVRTSSYATGGMDTCYIELNQDETHAFVSNYTSGSIAMFGVRPDRSLGPICSFVQHTKNGGTNNTRSCGRSPRWPTCSPSKVLRKGMLPLRS